MSELRLLPDFAESATTGHGALLEEERELDQELVCRRVVRVTHDTVTVVLEPTRPGLFAFVPGQYLTLEVDLEGRRVERCYTISSPPTRPHLLTITVKRVPGGEVSTHLHDRLRAGDRVHARGPLGDFSVSRHASAKYLLLSAGSGITPALSTVRTLTDLAEPLDVVLVHAARTPADLPARAELAALAQDHPGLRVVHVCEDDSAGETWSGPRGRLSAELLADRVPDLADREVFTCGPPPFMEAARRLLVAGGADPARCHEESFVLGSAGSPLLVPVVDRVDYAEPVEPTTTSADPATATVTFARSGCSVPCPVGLTVLEAADRAGVVLPSSCAEGLCGTCKSTLLSGEVEMSHRGGIRPREVAAGRFLPCCSTPLGDLVVDA